MTTLDQQLASLSPDQRRLVELWLLTRPEAQTPAAPPARISRRRQTDACPLSYAQQQLWFLYQWDSHSTAFNFPIAVRLSGPCELATLQRSLTAIVQRHEALRTTFIDVQGQPQQVVAPALPVPLRRVDLDQLPLSQREQQLQHLAHAEAEQPFDLERGPLLRARILRLAADEHVLLITIHHIVFDGWSRGVLVRELLALYSAFRAGRAAPLPPLPLQYADYATWQRRQLPSSRLAEQLTFWIEQLHEAPALLDLPTDYPRSPMRSARGASQLFALPPALTDCLKALSRQAGSTLFMTLLAAFDVLLYRYSRQTDIVVGTPIAGRTQAELEGLIGLFVNMLALRMDLAGNPTFRELLERVRAVALAAYAHQEISFEQILETLALRRDTSRHPIFQVMLALQNAPMPAVQSAGLSVEPIEVERTTARYDLALFLREDGQGLRGRLEYSSELFTPTTIRRICGQFRTLLEGIVADPDQRLAALPLLSAAEREQVIVAWNATMAAYPADMSIQQLAAAQAEQTPEAVAIIFNDQHLSYAELERRANQLAHYLRARGVGPDGLVGVCMERSVELVISLLGIFKAGGAYVPLDPNYPKERLDFMLEDSQAQVLITMQGEAEGWGLEAGIESPVSSLQSPVSGRVVDLIADWPRIAAEPTNCPRTSVRPDNLAYVIYTSGSTGQPKGVLGLHRGAINRFAWMWRVYPFAVSERGCQKTSLNFLDSLWEIFGPLLQGIPTLIIHDEAVKDPPQLVAALAAQHITRIVLVPSLLRLLLESSPDLSERLPALRLWVSSGEALSGELCRLFRACLPNRVLLNLYGSSEVSADVAWHDTSEQAAAAHVPIGRPIANMQIYLLDAQLQPVPVGVPGELYAGGIGLARGYHSRPDLTADRFIPNPFAVGSRQSAVGSSHIADDSLHTAYCILPTETRLYKTGDLARWRDDGQLEYLGRTDHQVKLRGFRIELGEIETVLTEHPKVREAVVVLRGDVPSEKRLVAYIVPTRGQGTGDRGQENLELETASLSPVTYHLSPTQLRTFLKEKLPEYMVPSAFVVLDTLPLTLSGKVDRRSLPAPDTRADEASYVAPRTPTEELLADIWGAVLGVEQVGVEDNFFALGGHSLLATQAISQLRTAFQIELPLRSLFEAPTLAALATRIAQERQRDSAPSLPPLEPQPRLGAAPLSFAQERLWFLDQFTPGSASYNIPLARRLVGSLDLPALAQALQVVCTRHEVLRTTFSASDGLPVQIIAPAHPIRLALLDLAGLRSEAQTLLSQTLARQDARQPFDLARGPLWRVALLRLTTTEHILLLTFHHSIADGWSLEVLVRELAACYNAHLQGQVVALPNLPLQYADYAIWQRQWLQGAMLEAQLAYWRAQLADAPAVMELPTDRPRPAVQSLRGASVPLRFDAELASELRALSRRAGATLFMALLAAFAVVLARYTGQHHILVGTPIAGRHQQALEGLIGFFVNTLVLRANTRGNPRFSALLSQVREVCLGAYEHQDLPFEKLVEALKVPRALSYPPLFQVLFALQNVPQAALRFGELVLEPLPVANAVAKFELSLVMTEHADGMRGTIEYNTDLFDQATIIRMVEHLRTLLNGIVADANQPIGALPLLTEAEREQLLAWNATAVAYSEDARVDQLVAAQTARTPDAVALVLREQHLSYDELDRRANQLAHYLQALGIGPELLVGVCMERSLDLVIGLLGILKAGAAYVPLDPSYPSERIAFMLEDSGAAVVLIARKKAGGWRLEAGIESAVSGLQSPVSGTVIDLRADWPQIARARAQPPSSLATSANLAYIIYTSGSTGRPKGVQIAQRGLLNLIGWHRRVFGLSPADRATLIAGVGFDASVWELWPYLVAGASLYIPDEAQRSAPEGLRDWLLAQAITICFVPTPLAEQLLPLAWPRRTHLRSLLTGGDRLHQAPPAQLPFTLINNYGPTEASVVATSAEIAPSTGVSAPPIGRAIANTQLYVLDDRLEGVPIGVAGELYIGGDGLARGYRGRPDLTAARFIPNPFVMAEDERRRTKDEGLTTDGRRPTTTAAMVADGGRWSVVGGRLYKTGDRVRYLADGTIEFLGRIDQQVKLRGYRIELGEIEAVLAQHPLVRESVVVAQEHAPGGRRLVAYVVQGSGVRGQGSGATNDQRPTTNDQRSEDKETSGQGDKIASNLLVSLSPGLISQAPSFVNGLRDHLKQKLPEYMLPSAFVLLDALPLTPNGKLDRAALPAPEQDENRPAYEAPRTPAEELLAGMWAEVLGHVRVGRDENFFELGGHSLLATQVVARVRQVFAVELPLRELFAAPTIAALAAQIEARHTDTPPALPPITPTPHTGMLPLSFAQQRLWFLDQLVPNSSLYNIPSVLRLAGTLDLVALRTGFQIVVARHESLRTTFVMHDGQAAQQIAPTLRLPWLLLDIAEVPTQGQETLVRHLLGAAAAAPFDLACGPLVRTLLVRLASTEHVLLLCMHHIISDGWSMSVLVREMAAIYAAVVAGRAPVLPALPVQYADFTLWQRRWLVGDVLETQLDYWRERLAGAPALLDLPIDHPRPAVQRFDGANMPLALDTTLTTALRTLSRQAGTTLFMTVLAGFATLLARWSNQADLVLGTPIAGRTRTELEGLIGCFVNTLALRVRLEHASSGLALLEQVREECLGAYAHQDLPFEQLVEALQVERNLSTSPLFQVLFVLQNAPSRPLLLPELTLQPLSIVSQTAKFDLALSLLETPNGLAGSWEYNTDLFEASTIARLSAHFATLLQAMCVNPRQRLAYLPLLSASERAQLLVEWNDTRREVRSQNSEFRRSQPIPDLLASDSRLLVSDSECVYELFADQAARTPHAIALVSGAQHLSYAELNRRANQLAHSLRALGVGPEVRVGLCLERSVEVVVALLGVLAAGGAYVPLDPSYPPARLAFLIEDSQAALVLTHTHLRERLARSSAPTLCLDSSWPEIAQQPCQPPALAPLSDHLAYIIYTSGSTGTPKGVLIPQRGISNVILYSHTAFALDQHSRVLQVASISFDASVLELFAGLTSGACVVIVVLQEQMESGAALGQLLEEQAVTTLIATPSLLELVPAGAYPHLRTLVIGGERSSAATLARWLEGRCVFNVYAPTEATIYATTWRAEAQPASLTPALGQPIANMQLYLLDQALQPVPIGVTGEIYLGGVGLARGYFARPELTAERFVPNPFSDCRLQIADCRLAQSTICNLQSAIGTRLYKTGDLARYRHNGELEFLGRADQQVKLRGYRIELGEITAVMRQHQAVHDAVVLVREDVPGAMRLVAYVVPTNDQRPTTNDHPADKETRRQGDEAASNLLVSVSPGLISQAPSFVSGLRDYLKHKLPEYMVPSAFVMLDALPLTPNGKLDRAQLPAPDGARPALDTGFVAPRTPVERSLATIWQQLLGIAQVGIHDNFFALGGDSILSIQIIARARQAGLHLNAKQLFQHQTIASLAAVAEAAPVPEPEQGLVSGPLPLTPIQRFFFEQPLPTPQHFNQALLLTVRGSLNPLHLSWALWHLARHHDALRLRFSYTQGGWQQVNAASTTAPVLALDWVDLSALAAPAQTAALKHVADELHTRLDLSQGPLGRVAFFDLGAGQPGRLLLVIHHLLVDGVSWRVLLEDLQSAYRQLSTGQAIALPPKTNSFHEWAHRLADYAQHPALQAELAYWRAQPWAQIAPLPLDHAPHLGANLVASARRVEIALSIAETRALLHDVPPVYRTQIDEVLLTALALALADWTGAEVLLVDREGHGREPLFDDLDISRTVGWFTTIAPLLLDLRGAAESGTALKAIKEQLRRLPHHGIGYGLLRYLSADATVRDELRALPQAEVSFNYLGQLDQVLTGSAQLAPAPEPNGAPHAPQSPRRYLLDITGSVLGEQLRVSISYTTTLHRHATIARLADGFIAALRGLIAHCLSPVAGGYTPSDFSQIALDQVALDQLLTALPPGADDATPGRAQPRLDDIYPLTPTQAGMLFHHLYEPASGVYFVQLGCTIEGRLDGAAFAQAWATLIARHTVLRTALVWDGLAEPLQVVYERVALPLETQDWRALPPEEQAARLAAYQAAERARGFDLRQAPLMRLALLRLAETRQAFVWSHHHLLMDGWCLPVLLKEVLSCYAAFCRGVEPELPPTAPYGNYIAWLRRQNLAQAEAFWRQALAGFEAPTPLPLDQGAGRGRAAGVAEADRYAAERLRLPTALTSQLQAFARQQRVTLNTLVQGAWARVLSCYSRTTDVVFGATVSGRPPELPGIEAMIGLFINTLPVRVQLPPQARVAAWLQDLQAQLLELRQYEYSPLVQVQGWSAVPRGRALFESLVVFENYPTEAGLLNRVSELVISDIGTAEQTNYLLTLAAMEENARLLLHLSYYRPRFEALGMARLLGQLAVVLEGMAAAPERRVDDLPLLDAAERAQILVEWNDTGPGIRGQGSGVSRINLADSACLHEMFAAQTIRTPDAVAIMLDPGDRGQGTGVRGQDEADILSFSVQPPRGYPAFSVQHLSYAELDQRANQLGHYLRRLGVGPEVLVGVYMERSIELVPALLGILKAGGAYLPLDPAYPPERLRFMLDDSQARVVLTAGGEAGGWRLEAGIESPVSSLQSPVSGTVVDLHSDWPAITRQPSAAPDSDASTENLAYVIYTSGSTGTPKGVGVAHRGLANLVAAQQQLFAIRPGERVLQFASPSFDASLFEITMALCAGAALCLGTRATLMPGSDLLRLLRDQAITLVTLPPAALALLPHADLPALRIVTVAGEACPTDLVARWAAGRRFFNLYGPTEATIWTTAAACLAEAPTLPIGRPISNTQVYLLDAQLEGVPIGAVGELYIGGVGLARGYLGRPDLTAERFIPNPFARVSGLGSRVSEDAAPNTRHPAPDTRLYKTGDLARYQADGSIEFLGRIDHQVKLRGYRIELGEIETALRQHSSVREAVVLTRTDTPGGARLVGYVVPTNDQRPTTNDENRGLQIEDSASQAHGSLSSILYSLSSELRSFLATRLPDYMVPSAFVLLDALPLTPNGKLDRTALPAPERDENRPTYEAPRTPTEEQLAAIWAEVLGQVRVGRHENFFELGGHSLLATQVVVRVRQVFAVELPLRELFSGATVAGMAEALVRARAEQQDRDELERLLAELDELSEEETQQLLAQDG